MTDTPATSTDQGGHVPLETHRQPAAEHKRVITDLDRKVAYIREVNAQRIDLLRAEIRLTLQAKAVCRRLCGGDKKEGTKLFNVVTTDKGCHKFDEKARGVVTGLLMARDYVSGCRKPYDTKLKKLAKTLPVAAWVLKTRGFGIASLGAIIGETGNLSNYDTVSKVWKRMGLAVMPDGKRQRRVVDKEKAKEMGYNPQRRSVSWVMMEAFHKSQTATKTRDATIYRAVFEKRKAYELLRSIVAVSELSGIVTPVLLDCRRLLECMREVPHSDGAFAGILTAVDTLAGAANLGDGKDVKALYKEPIEVKTLRDGLVMFVGGLQTEHAQLWKLLSGHHAEPVPVRYAECYRKAAHCRALRYTEKRVLRDLWVAWEEAHHN